MFKYLTMGTFETVKIVACYGKKISLNERTCLGPLFTEIITTSSTKVRIHYSQYCIVLQSGKSRENKCDSIINILYSFLFPVQHTESPQKISKKCKQTNENQSIKLVWFLPFIFSVSPGRLYTVRILETGSPGMVVLLKKERCEQREKSQRYIKESSQPPHVSAMTSTDQHGSQFSSEEGKRALSKKNKETRRKLCDTLLSKGHMIEECVCSSFHPSNISPVAIDRRGSNTVSKQRSNTF